jgi:hypothetical protein
MPISIQNKIKQTKAFIKACEIVKQKYPFAQSRMKRGELIFTDYSIGETWSDFRFGLDTYVHHSGKEISYSIYLEIFSEIKGIKIFSPSKLQLGYRHYIDQENDQLRFSKFVSNNNKLNQEYVDAISDFINVKKYEYKNSLFGNKKLTVIYNDLDPIFQSKIKSLTEKE